MANADLVDGLIATYRTLNMRIRPLDPATAGQLSAGGTTLRDVVAGLRNEELVASQTLKNMTLADTVVGGVNSSEVEILAPSDEQNVRVLLSEFGTAREAILALIREMSDEQWSAERPGPEGTTTIATYVQGITDRDRKALGQIDAMLPARAAS